MVLSCWCIICFSSNFQVCMFTNYRGRFADIQVTLAYITKLITQSLPYLSPVVITSPCSRWCSFSPMGTLLTLVGLVELKFFSIACKQQVWFGNYVMAQSMYYKRQGKLKDTKRIPLFMQQLCSKCYRMWPYINQTQGNNILKVLVLEVQSIQMLCFPFKSLLSHPYNTLQPFLRLS